MQAEIFYRLLKSYGRKINVLIYNPPLRDMSIINLSNSVNLYLISTSELNRSSLFSSYKNSLATIVASDDIPVIKYDVVVTPYYDKISNVLINKFNPDYVMFYTQNDNKQNLENYNEIGTGIYERNNQYKSKEADVTFENYSNTIFNKKILLYRIDFSKLPTNFFKHNEVSILAENDVDYHRFKSIEGLKPIFKASALCLDFDIMITNEFVDDITELLVCNSITEVLFFKDYHQHISGYNKANDHVFRKLFAKEVEHNMKPVELSEVDMISLSDREQHLENYKLTIEDGEVRKLSYNLDKPKVGIIIPTYEQKEYTEKCLKSIANTLDNNYDVKIYWVDNGSSTVTKRTIDKFAKDLNLNFEKIYIKDAVGYIKATNTGIKKALEDNCEYLVLQNNDTEFTNKNWLYEMTNGIHGNCVGTCPVTNSKDAIQFYVSIKKNLITDFVSFDNDKTDEDISNILARTYESKYYSITQNSHFIPSFFSIMLSAKAFKEIGLLDETFGKGYGDDVDFIQRLFIKGYTLNLAPAVYVLHDHHVSFTEEIGLTNIRNTIRARVLQCNVKNSLNTSKKKKSVIYTCITGNYDKLINLSYVNTEKYDYVLFTDSSIPNVPNYWKVFNISVYKDYLNLVDGSADSLTKLARFFKTHPHLFFSNYESSMWIDGNIDVYQKSDKLFDKVSNEDFIFTSAHPRRTCIYEEIEACKRMKKDSEETLEKARKFLLKNEMPKNAGMVQTGIIIRRHNEQACIDLMEEWWKYIYEITRRDQLSFNYVMWKNKASYLEMSWNDLNRNYIMLNPVHNK